MTKKILTFLMPSHHRAQSLQARWHAPHHTSASVMSPINYVKAVMQMDLINCLPSPP